MKIEMHYNTVENSQEKLLLEQSSTCSETLSLMSFLAFFFLPSKLA